MRNYVLDENGQPRLEPDLLAFGAWYESAECHVADDDIDGVRVSTVFLGIDHNHGGGAPILFETMVFGGAFNEAQERYHTREEAIAGHKAWVKEVKAASQIVLEGVVEFKTEDSGQALIATLVSASDAQPEIFVRIQSWDVALRHEKAKRLAGKKVRVTIEIIE